MAHDTPIKSLLLALNSDADSAVAVINRLKPEALCFVGPESVRVLVDTDIQPRLEQLPRRWDFVAVSDCRTFAASHHVLSQALPDLFRAWEVGSAELVVDLTDATPALAAALSLVALPYTARVVILTPLTGADPSTADMMEVGGRSLVWTHSNPWDEAAASARREACDEFNRGLFDAASAGFRRLETRVSGGQKPLYRALADLAEGYGCWERFQYRLAWEKLKTSLKALEMALVWGGPPGLKGVLPAMKQNVSFLERIVLDPQEVKEAVGYDLLAHAHRRLVGLVDAERGMLAVVRALEVAAQHRLLKQHRIKTWDVQPEQLPQALQESCRTCCLSDLDGKYHLPMHEQFRALAGLGDSLGQTYLAQWPKMKPLLDAARQGVLGHGCEAMKSERVGQLLEVVLTLTGIADASLPKFPTLHL